jgi:hypothetical protein
VDYYTQKALQGATLKEPDIPYQVAFAHTTNHPQIRLEQRKETLGAIFVHVTTRVFLLCMIDELVHVALHRPIAAGRVRVAPTARSHRDLGRLLHRLDGEIFTFHRIMWWSMSLLIESLQT